MEQIIKYKGQKFIQYFQSSNCFRGAGNETCCGSFEYIISGSKTIYTSDTKTSLNQNESFLKKSGGFISCGDSNNSQKQNSFESITFFLYPEIIKQATENQRNREIFNSNNNTRLSQLYKFKRSVIIDSYINSVLNFMNHINVISDVILETKLIELLLILSDSGKNDKVNSFINNITSNEDISFKKVVDSNMYNKLSISELAVLTNKSESTFKREFRRIYNDSPANWLKRKRLEKAATLLASKDSIISDIALKSGFETLAHFSKSFQQHYGVSPSKFKSDLI